ncbi:MAG: transposase [Acidobacteriota bacterium]
MKHRKRRATQPSLFGNGDPEKKRPGRKPKNGEAGVSHHGRPKLGHRYPAHVTMKVLERIGSLRRDDLFAAIEQAFVKGKKRLGFRLVQFSVEPDHIHLIVEAHVTRDALARNLRNPNKVLSRGMQALAIRIGKGINRVLGTKGQVFKDRYHMRPLQDPTQVRNALAYVLNNAWKHYRALVRGRPGLHADPYSSGPYFTGWRRECRVPRVERTAYPIAKPKLWLLAEGWKRVGLIGLGQIARKT